MLINSIALFILPNIGSSSTSCLYNIIPALASAVNNFMDMAVLTNKNNLLIINPTLQLIFILIYPARRL